MKMGSGSGSEAYGAVILLCLILCFASCQKELSDCFKGRGRPVKDERSLLPFTKILAYDKIDLVLIKDSLQPEHAVIESYKNLVPSIILTVNQDELTIRDNNTCNFVRDLDNRTNVKVYLHDLRHLEVHDDVSVKTGGRMHLDKLLIMDKSLNDMELELSALHPGIIETHQESAGNIKLKGYAAIFISVVDDVGSMDASGLQGDYTFVFNNGPRDCYVQPYKVLGGQINYSGNVYYNRMPIQPISFQIKGSGRLIMQ
jgi:hypothetical protein